MRREAGPVALGRGGVLEVGTDVVRPWAWLLSGSLILVVCIRFLSENLALVPRMAQFVDVPLTMIVAAVAVLAFVRGGHRSDVPRLGLVLFLFVLLCVGSARINSSRIALFPVAMFVFGFAAPLIFAAAISHARLARRDVRSVLRTFFWLGVLQLVVGILYGLPLFLATRNPDYVSGTFGQNAYQFTYFLGLWLLYVLGGVLLGTGPRRWGHGLGVGAAVLMAFGLFYAAQYRAMLVFFTLAIVVTVLASPARLSRRMLLTFVVSAFSVVTLVTVATAFPNLKLLQVFDLLKDSTPIVESGKVQSVKNLATMYEELPHSALVGSGPGTFSSRGYRTFALSPDGRDGAGSLAVALMGGQGYSTDVARKYVDTIPDVPIQGGTTASSPMSSFTALAAEVGPLGLLVYLAAYAMALVYSYRRLQAGAKAGDVLVVRLAFVCFGGLLLLLIQALFDNWLETTRVSIPLWILVGLLFTLGATDTSAGRRPPPARPGAAIPVGRGSAR